ERRLRDLAHEQPERQDRRRRHDEGTLVEAERASLQVHTHAEVEAAHDANDGGEQGERRPESSQIARRRSGGRVGGGHGGHPRMMRGTEIYPAFSTLLWYSGARIRS